MGCKGEVRGDSNGKTMKNLVYQAEKYDTCMGKHSCAEGQSGQLLTWADITGSETSAPNLKYAFLISLPKYL